MKRRVSALALALALILSISAAAATPRSANPIYPDKGLTVTKSGALCELYINPNVKVSVSGTVPLYRDGSFLKSWSVTSDSFSETYTGSITHGSVSYTHLRAHEGPNGSDSVKGSITYDY